MKAHLPSIALLGLLLSAPSSWGAIYTCVTDKGRKLTSDRPIPECADREQKELNSNATVKRTVKPGLTALEQRALDEKQAAKQAALVEERTRAEEEKRRNKAFTGRYPNAQAHDKARAEHLKQFDVSIQNANSRIEQLGVQRKKIDDELEFYKKDPSKTPAALKRQIDDHERSVNAQKSLIAKQEEDKKKQNARFDEELVRLKQLWLAASSPPSAPSLASSASSASPAASQTKSAKK